MDVVGMGVMLVMLGEIKNPLLATLKPSREVPHILGDITLTLFVIYMFTHPISVPISPQI